MARADCHFYPLEIVSGANQVKVTEHVSGGGTSTFTATVSPGTYMSHREGAGTLPYAGLLGELESALTSASPNGYTYTITPETASGSQLTNGHAKLRATDGVSDYALELSIANADWTLDPRYLGWPDGSSTSAQVNPVSPLSLLGQWQSWSITPDHGASDKSEDETVDLAVSTDDVQRAYQLQYGEAELYRTYKYTEVPSGHIEIGKADDATGAATAGLATGDTHNAWQHLWRSARELDEILVLHDTAESADSFTPTSHEWETYKFQSRKQRGRFREPMEVTREHGEFFRLMWDARTIDSGSGYTHTA